MPSLAAVFRNSCHTFSKNHCLSTLHVLFACGCGWVSLPVCVNNDSTVFKHFDPLYALLCWKQFCPYLATNCRWISAPFIPSDTIDALLHVVCPWCKPLVEQSSLHHAHRAQTGYNWTTLAAYHRLTLSYSMARSQQCCQSYSENIQTLPFHFESPSYI
jgi:hypothetical protein